MDSENGNLKVWCSCLSFENHVVLLGAILVSHGNRSNI